MLRFGVGPRAIHVLNGLQIEPNHVAGLDELRHPHFDAVGELCRLERAVRLLVRGGSGVRDFRLDGIRKHPVGRPLTNSTVSLIPGSRKAARAPATDLAISACS